MLQVDLCPVAYVTAKSIRPCVAEIEQFEDIGMIETGSFHEEVVIEGELLVCPSCEEVAVDELASDIVDVGV